MSIVKNSAYEICQEAKHVVINDDALESFITNTQSKVIEFIPWEAWPTHYVGPNQLDYIFALDALNFCFWPKEAFEYDNLAQNLKNIIQRDLNGLSPLSLAHMSDHYISSEIFQDQHFPMISERCRLLRELGQKTLDGFDGDFKNMISACKNSAEKLVDLVTASCPGFRDACIYTGRQVFFYKRAQILASDLYSAGLCDFQDIGNITMFPDYRVPQVLNTYGVLKYSQKLQDKIDQKAIIASGSEMEIEIRAASVKVCDIIASRLSRLPILTDQLIWQMGESTLSTLKNHHRTLTVFY